MAIKETIESTTLKTTLILKYDFIVPLLPDLRLKNFLHCITDNFEVLRMLR